MALGLLHDDAQETRRSRKVVVLAPLAAIGLVILSTLAFMLALGGGDFGCVGGGGSSGPPPSRAAVADIPRARLVLYQRAGRRFDIDWTFLASIGAQECDHGSCAGANSSGCGGPMQIAVVRGSACSPGSGPTEWERWRVDGDGDGRTNFNDPADAIFTAARLLRFDKGAPPIGGSFRAYREAACRYYGACADATVAYADEVMARAVQYGFQGAGSPDPSNPTTAQPDPAATSAAGCGATGTPLASSSFGPVIKARAPRHLAPLPSFAVAPGSGTLSCDARIVPNVVALVRRFRVVVTACFAIHSLAGEHPLGAAVDLVPADGDWSHTLALARAVGWNPLCAASGVAPACARAPWRFVGYNGFPDHGDPLHCIPCAGGPHLHLSWETSASVGQPENRPRTSYYAPTWIEVFTGGASGSA